MFKKNTLAVWMCGREIHVWINHIIMSFPIRIIRVWFKVKITIQSLLVSWGHIFPSKTHHCLFSDS